MLNKNIEALVIASENKVNTLEYKLADFFKQAENASGLKPIDPDYIEFKLGNTKKAPMQFVIDEFEDMDDTSILANAHHKKLSAREFFEMLKAYDEKLSELLAENFDSKYTLEITASSHSKYHSARTEYHEDSVTEYKRINAIIKNTEEDDNALY